MSWTPLNKAQVFTPGCPLWALAPTIDHPLYKKIDWYMNFQLTRVTSHQPQTISTTLREIIIENQLPRFEAPPQSQNTTLIYTHNLLPAEMVLLVSGRPDKKTWSTELFSVWQKLKMPTLRVFLPPFMTLTDFRAQWPIDSQSEISVFEMKPV